MSHPGQKPMGGLIAAIGPMMREEFGMGVVTIKQLEKRAKVEADDLVTRLRKGGL